MKKLSLVIIALIISFNLTAQGWVGNSTTNSLFSVNSSLGVTPLNVGIGTNSPIVPLDVNGRVRIVGSNWTSGNTGSALNITGGAYNQMNVSYNNNWGLLIGYSDGSLTTDYHGLNNAAIINVNNSPLRIGTSNTTRMSILGNGFVGIGTLTPSEQFHTNSGVRFEGLTNIDTLSRIIVQDNNGKLYWRRANTLGSNGNFWSINGNANAIAPTSLLGTTINNNFIGTTNNIPLALATNNLERMRIANNGLVGINNLDPQFRLHIIENTPWDQITNTAGIWSTNILTGNGTQNTNSQVGKGAIIGSLEISTTGNLQTGPRSILSGVIGRTLKSGSGNVNSMISGISTNIGVNGTGNVAELASLRASAPQNFPTNNGYTGTITNCYGLLIENFVYPAGLDVSGRITNRYGIFQAGVGERNFFAGNVGIGTNNPSQMLHVAGNVLVNGTFTTSDQRYKKEIESIKSPLDLISQIGGKTYYFKTEEFKEKNFESNKQYGFIAQEIEKIIPEIVFTDSEGYKSVNYTSVVPVLVEAIKELNTKVEKQNNAVIENEALKSEISALKSENQIFKDKFELLEKSISLLCESGCAGLEKAKQNATDADVLYQSIPNPTDNETLINFYLSKKYNKASIQINSLDGKSMETIVLDGTQGKGSVKIQLGQYAAQTYFYSLIVDNKVVDTKKLTVIR
jgi:hypothetical protein